KELLSAVTTHAHLRDLEVDLCFAICQSRFPNSLVEPCLESIVNYARSNRLSDSERLLIAEFALRLRGDASLAQVTVSEVKQPSLYSFGSFGQWKGLSPFVDRIRL